MYMLKKNYALIDVFKFICSIMVIGIHCPFFLSYNETLTYWWLFPMRIAVPFFFLTSSFFLFDKLHHQNTKQEKDAVIKNYIIRILKLWIFWSIVYFMIRIFQIVLEHRGSLLWNLKVIARDFIFSGISEHLWYLSALLFAILLVYFMHKKVNYKMIFLIAVICYGIGLVGNTYVFLLPNNLIPYYEKFTNYFVGTRNGIFFGFIYCAIGALLSSIDLVKISSKKMIVLLILSVSFMIGEFAWVSNYRTESVTGTDIWIFAVPVTVCLFILLLKSNRKTNQHTVLMRKMSLNIFLIHPAILTAFELIFTKLGLGTLKENSILYFLTVTGASLLLAYGIEKLKDKYEKLKLIL